jgi:hypothetical protein
MQNVAIHTFSTLIFRWKSDTNLFRAALIVAGIWIAIILNVAINVGINGASRFYGPTGYCESTPFTPVWKLNLFSRVLDNPGISCTKDGRRLFVDVDFGLFKCFGICSRLSCVGWFR